MQTKAISIEEFGGPEVMRFTDAELPRPKPGEARVRHTAIGLNFIDTYHRSGLYAVDLPSGLGKEAAGVVEAIGEDVREFAVGDRVAYCGGPLGAYAAMRNIEASHLVPLPDAISDEDAAASLLKGLTAWYLLRSSYRVQPGDPVVIYAAAGGVGSIASQWASASGAKVIGIVSTKAKAERARAQGCAHVITYDEDIPRRVRELTDGEGAAVVYDSVGRDTFFASLDSLRPHGMMVSFGNSSGPVEPFAPSELAKRHSLYLTRPSLFDFVDTRDRLLGAASELFGRLESGAVKVRVEQRYPLQDAVRAHRDLEARRTTGSTVLVP